MTLDDTLDIGRAILVEFDAVSRSILCKSDINRVMSWQISRAVED
jgi:hypothetical protein